MLPKGFDKKSLPVQRLDTGGGLRKSGDDLWLRTLFSSAVEPLHPLLWPNRHRRESLDSFATYGSGLTMDKRPVYFCPKTQIGDDLLAFGSCGAVGHRPENSLEILLIGIEIVPEQG